MTNLFSLEGKNAWVTGACYGIGFAIAKAFAQAGAKTIIFNARHEEERLSKITRRQVLKTSRVMYAM